MSVHDTNVSRCSQSLSEIERYDSQRLGGRSQGALKEQEVTQSTFLTMIHHLSIFEDLQSIMEISQLHQMDSQQDHDRGLLLVDEQKMVDIEQPHHHDVLCGRGKFAIVAFLRVKGRRVTTSPFLLAFC
jgi:hypothetical protein